MSNTPSIEQFMNADYSIVHPGFIGGDPAITVENAIAPEPFYFEVDVDTWHRLHQEALCESDEDDYVNRALEIEVELNEDFGITL